MSGTARILTAVLAADRFSAHELRRLAYDEAETAVLAMGGVVKPRPPKIASFILNEKNKPRTIIANVLKVFHHDPRWKGILRYNVFSDEVEVCQAPPPYDPMPWPVQALRKSSRSR